MQQPSTEPSQDDDVAVDDPDPSLDDASSLSEQDAPDGAVE
jgi:hypothetical protein